MTKATTGEGDDIRRSLNWVFAKRGFLKVTDNELNCGNWRIPYSEIEEAVLFRAKTLFFIPCYILKIKSKGNIYQFGLNPGKFWHGKLPFAVSRETAKKDTPLSASL